MKIGLIALCFLPFLFAQAQKTLLPQLNSTARETNLSISPNGKFLYFMSDRGGQPWSDFRREDKATGIKHYDGDIWYSINEDGVWLPPVCLDNSINTSNGEDEPNITADGQRVYFQSFRDNYSGTGGPYYMATLKGVVWENPVGLGGEITRFFGDLSTRTRIDLHKRLKKANLYEYYLKLKDEGLEESQWKDSLRREGFETPDFWIATDGMSISPDEKIFIVSAYIPETANYDLMISRKNEDGVWSYPKPLTVNSAGDEKSVFIAADNQTVYFASNKPGGLGGLDIYKTTLTSGTGCTPAQSLGSTFNTTKDDNGLILTGTGKTGFMTSDGDIYAVNLDWTPPKAIVINGYVIDQYNNPLAAQLELSRLALKSPLSKSSSNSHTGEFSFSTKREEDNFTLFVRTREGSTADTSFTVTSTTPDVLDFVIVVNLPKREKAAVVAELESSRLRKGEVFRIDQLQFDENSAVIKKEHFPMLNDIARVLRLRDKLVIEIGGHTNALANQQFSEKLSLDRALAVYNYLLGQKVPMKNMQYKGYGKRMPIAPNDRSTRALNQRVEIKILETD